jgi:putative hydrolase of the HAD superfamily
MSDDIKAVTFDVGGTLIEPWPSVGHVYAEIAELHGHQFAPETLNKQFRAAWKAKQNFQHTRADWAALVRATFGTDACDGFFPELYERFASAKVWRVFDDVRPALLRLKNQGMKLGIISNWDERLRPLLESLELTPFFDAIVVSVEVGACKPSPEIFRQALRVLDLPASLVLHVGDSETEDIGGAKAIGMKAVIRKALQFPFDTSD